MSAHSSYEVCKTFSENLNERGLKTHFSLHKKLYVLISHGIFAKFKTLQLSL